MSSPQTALVRHGLRLSYATLAYNSLEGIIAILAGLAAGSIALVGFGADSLIEVTASLTAIWRLRSDSDPGRRERSERMSLRLIGILFLALAAFVAADAVESLVSREVPDPSAIGIALAAASLVVMPSSPMPSAESLSPWAAERLLPSLDRRFSAPISQPSFSADWS